MVTPPSHGGNTGSNPVGDANLINNLRHPAENLCPGCVPAAMRPGAIICRAMSRLPRPQAGSRSLVVCGAWSATKGEVDIGPFPAPPWIARGEVPERSTGRSRNSLWSVCRISSGAEKFGIAEVGRLPGMLP